MEMWRKSEIRDRGPEVSKDPEVHKDPEVNKDPEVVEVVADQAVKTFVMFRGSISPAVVKSRLSLLAPCHYSHRQQCDRHKAFLEQI